MVGEGSASGTASHVKTDLEIARPQLNCIVSVLASRQIKVASK